jgi:enoyl-CoA hydratase/carnithine racemase
MCPCQDPQPVPRFLTQSHGRVVRARFAIVSGDMVLVERHGKVLEIVLNRPHVLNAMDAEMKQALSHVMAEYARDDSLLAAILRGAGDRAFSTGADLKAHAAEPKSVALGRTAFPWPSTRGSMPGYDDVDSCPKPLIAAIDGYCLGGGFELALLCDIRLATTRSTFGLPEPRRGRMAGPGLMNLSRMIPLGEALRMHLTGSPIGAQRAYEIGLITDVSATRDELMTRAMELAEQVAECAPLAVQSIKRIVRDGRDLPLDSQWQFYEMFAAVLEASGAPREGARAFAEKRAPQWPT